MAVAVAQTPYYNDKHNTSLLRELNRERFETDSFCDATLQVDDTTFNIHKCIVGRLSSFFRNLFKVEMKEKFDSFANMKGLNSETMESVLTYIYTGSVDINDENVFDLVAASDYLLIEGLKVCCQDYMVKNITTNNCIKYYLTGKTYKWVLLKRKAEGLFHNNFEEITKQKEFAALERDDLLYILSRIEEDLLVLRERNVYEGIMAWVKHDIDKRKRFLPEMLDLVVFKLLSQQYLKNIKKECLVQEISGMTTLLNNEIEWKKARSRGGRNLFVEVNGTKVRLFDLLTSWINLPDLPSAARGACSVAYQDHLYVIGGGNNNKMIHRLDLNDEEAKWEEVGQTLQERNSSRAVVLNDMIVISGGHHLSKSIESFTYVNSKIQQAEMKPMVIGRHDHSMVECNGSIYCFGNYMYGNATSSEKYSKQKWSVVQPEKLFKSSTVAVATFNEIFVFGVLDDRLKVAGYDLDFNSWRMRSECPFKHKLYSASYREEKIYTFGEWDQKYVLGEYNITLDSWRMVCSFPCVPVDYHSPRLFAAI